jgi:hypothetical protein
VVLSTGPHGTRTSTRSVTLAALLALIGRPGWWVLALAGFLARGGIILFVLAVVTLPSPLALSDIVGPLLVPIAFGTLTAQTIVVLLVGVGAVVAWILVGTWIGAATEVALIHEARAAAEADGLPTRWRHPPPRSLVGRVMIARLVAHVPLAITLALGTVQVVNVAYVELTSPVEVVTPLALRVVFGAFGPLIAIAVAWLTGEVVGGLAARRIVLGGQPVAGAVVRSFGDMLGGSPGAVLSALLTTAVLVLDVGASLIAVAFAWAAARGQVAELLPDPAPLALSLMTLAAAWCLALAVTGLSTAWRSVAMTFEAERSAASAEPAATSALPSGSGAAAESRMDA